LFDSVTSTVTDSDTVFCELSPLQVSVKVYDFTSDKVIVSVPEPVTFVPSQSPEPEHPMALVVVHDKSTELPETIDDDEAVKVFITGLKIDGDSGSEEPPPPPPPQDIREIVNRKEFF
jgi:hypothetical protein